MTVLDTPYAFSTVSIPFYECNFHIIDHDVYYGDGSITSATAKAGAIISLKNGDLKDIFFQNASAGDTATVHAVFTTPQDYVKKVLKI